MRHGEWVVPGVVVAGVVVTPLLRPGVLRLWTGPATAGVLVPLLLVLLAVATASLLRRDHVWADPAVLTWRDGDRETPVRRRLLVSWALRFGAVAYAVAALATTVGWADPVWFGAVFTVAAAHALAVARLPRAWSADLAAPLLLVAAVFVDGLRWPLVGALAALTLGALLQRPAVAGRFELVRGWRARLLRSVSTVFGDLVALLPPARPVRLRQAGAARFVLAGALGRWESVPFAVLVVVAAPVLAGAFAATAAVLWVGVAAYLAALPFAGALAEVHRRPGLRRWVPASTVSLKACTAVVSAVPAAVCVGAVVLAGLPFEPLLVPLAAWSVVRTVTRPDIDYAAQGAVALFGGTIPVGIIAQVFRGPDLLLLGVLVLAVF
ncbi:hypothetical protein L6E12_19270 [Actinokineospora sp. PR83]|uniref:hypothetical protein n=1 Tax=Actinokineospora sp. PR83 TaxID=2884908 RepID=UPI001F2B0043|nr:hypothetical protein [Actinokineospora sp. PR83]MCG8917924.1 hypothetical protein [Actinokineospora sp. PR83]